MKQSFPPHVHFFSQTLARFFLFVRIIIPLACIFVFVLGCGGSGTSNRYVYEYSDGYSTGSSYSQRKEIKGGSGDVFVSPKAKNRVYWKVAVMMFKAPKELVGASISDMFATELLKTYKYELIERSQIKQILDEQVLSLKGVTDNQLAMKIGEILGVDGVIVGTVPEFGLRSAGHTELPSVGINIRMIDVQSGTIVWSVSNSGIAKQSISLSAFARQLIKSTVINLLKELVRTGDTIAVQLHPPAILDTDAGIRQNTIKISSSPNDGYTAYNLLRSRRQDGTYRKIATLPKRTGKTVIAFQDTNLLDAETYHYKVAGIYHTGLTSLESEPESVTTVGAPHSPRNFTAESGMLREVHLSWNPSQSSMVKGYVIYKSASRNGPFKKLTYLKDKKKQKYIDKDKKSSWNRSASILKDGTEYFYKIRTVNIVDVESPDSEIISVVTMGPPGSLKGVTAQGGLKKRIKLSWDPVKSKKIKGYTIYRSKSLDGHFEKIFFVSGRNSYEYTDKGSWEKKLLDNTEYFYKIYTVNIVDVKSSDAVIVSAVTKPVPQPVTGLFADQNEARQVSLSWQENSEHDIRRYEVFRGDSPRNIKKRIKQLKSDQQMYTDTKLKDGMTYYYKVRAIDLDDLVGAFSDVVSATTKSIPEPPAGLTAFYGNGEIKLSWDKNPESDIVRYEVFTGSSFRSKVGETSNTSMSTTKGVKPGKILRFKIRAIDRTDLESELSDSVSITVPE